MGPATTAALEAAGASTLTLRGLTAGGIQLYMTPVSSPPKAVTPAAGAARGSGPVFWGGGSVLRHPSWAPSPPPQQEREGAVIVGPAAPRQRGAAPPAQEGVSAFAIARASLPESAAGATPRGRAPARGPTGMLAAAPRPAVIPRTLAVLHARGSEPAAGTPAGMTSSRFTGEPCESVVIVCALAGFPGTVLVLGGPEPALPGARGSFERSSALTAAQRLAATLFQPPPIPWRAGQLGDMHVHLATVASLRAAVNIALRAGLAASNLTPGGRAHAATLEPDIPLADAPTALREEVWLQLCAVCDSVHGALRAALLSAPPRCGDANWFKSWAIPVSAADAFTDVPADARGRPTAPPPSMDFAQFSHNGAAFDPPCTARPALPARQHPTLVPRSINCILTGAAINAIQGWISHELTDLRAYSLNSTRDRRRNRPLALGAEALQPGATGFVWDLHCSPPVPLALHETARTTLDGARFSEMMGPDYPDQALISAVAEGVVYGAEIAHQIVLLPNLLSMANGMETVRAEIERMASLLNRLTLHESLPCVPIRVNPQGSLPLRPSELWKNAFIFLDSDGVARLASESVLGFGMAAASNYAQQLATAVAREVARRMDCSEAPILDEMRRSGPPPLIALLSRRDALSARTGREQARLFSLAVYTDDAKGEVCLELGLLRAHPRKRRIGQWLITLGIGFALTLGIVCIPSAKRILHGEAVPFTDFGRVAGLLEHFKSALDLLGSLSYNLYDGFPLGLLDPGAPIASSAAMIDSCRRWMHVLRTSTCNSFAPSAYSGRPALTGSAQILVFSDASKLGIGVFCQGLYAYLELEGEATLLPMAVLKFVALFLAVLALCHVVRGLGAAWHTDSSVVRAVVANMSASSVLTRLVHLALLESPEWAELSVESRMALIETECNIYAARA
ncbi:hypothetical protein T492DRAFT_850603 [Pavlovales sp. CCMP2436]|nr:hypothetical protein T492DRAFT_850603 [Pavlovales sp. CCMP2436]